jgi:rod shape-determining protein MreB and related proteins
MHVRAQIRIRRGNVGMLPAGFRLANEIGMDLGTGNTLVYVQGEGVVLNEPSVVAVERNTRAVRAVGLEAKRMLGRTAADLEAIRPLKDGVIADVDVAEAMIRHYLKQVTSRRFIKSKPRVVMGVPSGITELERRAVRTAAAAAGAREVYMLAEPMAAAIGAGLPVDTPTGNMVVDIGGGTTEIAVIALGGIVADTSIRVAGDEMDQAIITFARKHHNMLIGEPTAEAVKMKIGSACDLGSEEVMEVKGRDLVSGIPKTVQFLASEIREAISEPVAQIVEATLRALELTPPELASDIVDQGIVLTGGGALIRGLDRLLASKTGLTVHIDPEPLTCVVRGTAAVIEQFTRFRGALAA